MEIDLVTLQSAHYAKVMQVKIEQPLNISASSNCKSIGSHSLEETCLCQARYVSNQ